MKHRLTLSRHNAELVLAVMPWDVWDVSPACRGILTVQVVKDFLPAGYFINRVAEVLGVEPLGGDQDAVGRFVWPYSDALANDIIDKLNRLASPERDRLHALQLHQYRGPAILSKGAELQQRRAADQPRIVGCYRAISAPGNRGPLVS